MTQEEKADELIEKFTSIEDAIICVDEIIDTIDSIHIKHMSDAPTLYWDKKSNDQYHYWQEVKQILINKNK